MSNSSPSPIVQAIDFVKNWENQIFKKMPLEFDQHVLLQSQVEAVVGHLQNSETQQVHIQNIITEIDDLVEELTHIASIEHIDQIKSLIVRLKSTIKA